MRQNEMSGQSNHLARILLLFHKNISDAATAKKDYTKFERNLFSLLLILVLIPLLSISFLSHQQYKNLLLKNELTELVLNIQQAEKSMERFGSKLLTIIKFVALSDGYQELTVPDNLKALFDKLQSHYPDFADIEIIDVHGKQKAYVGPYALDPRDYKDQKWYQEVLQRGVYISNIFSGYRQVPHFVIAISQDCKSDHGKWVLRVTIDGKRMQQYVDTVSTTLIDDVYLENTDGIAQTQPRKYGKQGELSPLIVPKSNKYDARRILNEDAHLLNEGPDITVRKTPRGEKVLKASMPLGGTNWNLVMIKESFLQERSWFFFQLRLFTIVFLCLTGAILVALRLSRGVTVYIRESDKKREQFFAEVEESEKLASIGRLAAGVAHEINNPLSIINQKAGLVNDYFELTGPFQYKEEMLEALDGIEQSVLRCRTITHRLLGFARHTDVEIEELDINRVLEETAAFLSREASYNQIQMVFDLQNDIHPIYSDKGQLQQVFLNIINNAVDAIGSNGTITLSTGQEDQETIKVTISDTGEGMSEETKKRIFEPFYTTKETGKGTGLGLSISYGIIEKLGGRIAVTSAENVGTTFEINLPVRHDKE